MYGFGFGVLVVFASALLPAELKDFSPRDFEIECTSTGIQVSISKLKAGNLIFSFIDQSCHAVDNSTHLVAITKYGQCGTIKREYEYGTEFTNELLSHHSIDGVCPHLKLKVTCFNPHDRIVHSRKWRQRRSIESRIERTKGCPKSKYAFDQPITRKKQPKFVTCPFLIGVGEPIPSDGTLTRKYATHHLKVKGHHKIPCKPLQNKGHLHLLMRIANDETYSNDFVSSPQPQRIEWYEDVYYEILHLGGHKNYKLVPIMCHATPDPDPDNKISYVYISNGCPVDSTVRFYPSPNSASSRFSITSFQFQHSKSRSFYSHCEVLVCDKKDNSPQCQRQCQAPIYQRRKRRAVSKSSIVPGHRSRRDMEKLPKNEIVKTIQNEKNIDVTCLEDRMIVRIRKRTKNTFHLKASGCIAMQDENGYKVITASYKECGTTIEMDQNWIYYSNEIIESPSPNSMIIRGPLLKQSVKCAYKKKSVSAPVVIKFKWKPLVSHGVGSLYKVKIDMYKDKDYLIKNRKSLVEISEDKNMYFEVKIDVTDALKAVYSKANTRNLGLHLDTCLGYNQPTKFEKQKSYVFIQDGCPYKDETVRFYENSDMSKVRFSVKPFKFGNDRSILINCYVTACSDDEDSKCNELSKIGREAYCARKDKYQ